MIKLVIEDLDEETRIEVHAKSGSNMGDIQYHMKFLFDDAIRGAIIPLPVVQQVPVVGQTDDPKPPVDDDELSF